MEIEPYDLVDQIVYTDKYLYKNINYLLDVSMYMVRQAHSIAENQNENCRVCLGESLEE